MSGSAQVRLGDVCEILIGNSAPQDAKCFEGGSYPFVRTSDVGNIHFGILNCSRDALNDMGIKGLRLFKKGSVLFPKSGASVFLNHRVMLGIDAFVSSHLAVIEPHGTIDANYLLHCLSTIDAKSLLQNSDYPSLRRGDIANVRIFLPPLAVQRRVAAKLDWLCDIVAKRTQQLSQLQQLVKSRFVEMFGENQEWERVGLLDVGKCKNGINFAPNECGYEIHCIGVGNFKDFAEISNVESTPLVSLSQRPSDDLLLRDGDMLFVRSNGNKSLVGRCVVVRPGDTEVTFSGFCIRYRVTLEKLDPFYLVHFLRQSQVRRLLQGRGANIQNMSQRTLAGLTIPLPPLALQREFAAFVAKVDKLAFAIQKGLESAEKLYRQQLSEAFS